MKIGTHLYWQFGPTGICAGGPSLGPHQALPEGWTEIGIFIDRVVQTAVSRTVPQDNT